MDHQPSDKRAELSRCEDVDLEHADWMRTERFVPHAVDTEFGELVPDACPEFVGEGGLGFVLLFRRFQKRRREKEEKSE